MSIILLLLSVICASVPMVCFVAVAWWLDRYDREPLWLVALVFLWGAVGAIAGALATGLPLMLILTLAAGAEAATTMAPILIAPLTEEVTKGIVLFAVVRSRHFDNVTDGFVYGAAAGLGFGMTENFMYFLSSIDQGAVAWLQVVLIRPFFTAVMHATATATVGAAIGFARYRRAAPKLACLATGLGLAVGMHAVWNGLIVATVPTESAVLTLANFGILGLEVLVVAAVFLFSIHSEKSMIRRHLHAEATAGLLPSAHASVLTSVVARNKTGWLEPGIPQGPYVQAATRLAFKLEHARVAPRRRRGPLLEEAVELRAQIARLRSGAA